MLYHGTDVTSAADIREHGIRESALQRRDRGFFGDGFYLTERRENAEHHAETVASQRDERPAVLSVDVDSDATVFHPGDFDGVAPDTPPKWHDEFIEWVRDTLDEAAVWEQIPGKTRADIMESGVAQRTPGTPEFDDDTWRTDVTRFAQDAGYDLVRWGPTEIVVVNTENPPLTF